MANQQPVIAVFEREFLQLADAEHSSTRGDQDQQWEAFARTIRSLCNRKEYRSVQAAFDRLELCLAQPNPDLRQWVAGLLQVLQDGISWNADCGDSFQRFLGERTRRMWAGLDSIRCDLADCSALEAEVLMWRVIHHRAPF